MACSNPEPQIEPQAPAGEPKERDGYVESLPRMVAIHASYCSVCKEMKPIVEKIKAECDLNNVRVESFDVSNEKYEHFVEEYRIKGLPTYLFLDEAEYEVARLVGVQSESALKQALGVLRGEDCPGVGRIMDQKES
jgi:thiol-disulfide isomerase/thioredoxin